jgi:hypothetical protein
MMNFKEAKEELTRCLKESKTISVPKLRNLINAMNISLKEANHPLILKKNGRVPTVIDYRGRRYVLDHVDNRK